MGARIQRILIEELGGLRLTIPDIRELAKEERNERIRAAFTGANHEGAGIEVWVFPEACETDS